MDSLEHPQQLQSGCGLSCGRIGGLGEVPFGLTYALPRMNYSNTMPMLYMHSCELDAEMKMKTKSNQTKTQTA